MKGKKWLIGFLLASALILGVLAAPMIYVDPFFHYHKPHTDKFYYKLHSQYQRSINDGIEKNFDYNAMIIGSSMTENFHASELDALFAVNSIKVPVAGATMYEANNNIAIAIEHNPELRMVVRCLDSTRYFDAKDSLREDLGEYPDYLYDDFFYNDVNYFFNRELLFGAVVPMIMENIKNSREPGIESFDSYSIWYTEYPFSPDVIYYNKDVELNTAGEPIHISDSERQAVIDNIEMNVCSLARENPDMQFYYYIPPYSAAWWQELNESGEIYKQLEAERLVVEHILGCDNIKLFSLSAETAITADLNNYRDNIHYGPWINSLLLIFMSEDRFLLTEDNYEAYLCDLERIYTEFDYNALLSQKSNGDNSITVKHVEDLYGYELGDYSA